MFKSIKTRMIVLVSILALVLVGGSTFYNCREAGNILEDTLFVEAENITQKSVESIKLWTKEKGKLVESLSQLESIESMDWERQFPVLKTVVENDPQIESISMVRPDGEMINTDQFETNVAHQQYFKDVSKSKELVFSEPLESFSTGRPITIVASPVFQNEEFVGVLSAIVALDILQDMISDMNINNKGHAVILDQGGNVLAHPNDQYLGNKEILEEKSSDFKTAYNNFLGNKNGALNYQQQGEEWLASYSTVEDVNWTVILTAAQSKLFSPLDSLRTSSILSVLIAVVLGVSAIYFIAGSIVNPIKRVAAAADNVAAGDLTQRIDLDNYTLNPDDELGHLLSSVNGMIENLQQIINKVQGTAEELAASSQELTASGSQVENSAEEVGRAIENVASGAEEQSAQIEEVSSSVEELNDLIEDNAQKSEAMIEEAETVKDEIAAGNDYVKASISQSNQVQESNQLVAANVEELGEKSKEIGEIIDLINQIADQTNLLALNAAIEAARAGEAGRGFSVVADEIRELAEESAGATEKINKLIQAIQNSVAEVIENNEEGQKNIAENVKMAEETGEVFTNIENSAEDLLKLINQVAQDSAKMNENSDYVERGITDIAEVSENSASNSEEVAAASEEQIAATEEIVSGAERLSEYADRLKSAVDQFDI